MPRTVADLDDRADEPYICPTCGGPLLLARDGTMVDRCHNCAEQRVAERAAEKVVAAMAAAPKPAPVSPASPPTHYTTNKRRPIVPPGKSRDWLLDKIKEMGAYGARNPGRDWTIPIEGYDRWVADQDAAKCRASAPGAATDVDARAIAEGTLAKAGLRPTKGDK